MCILWCTDGSVRIYEIADTICVVLYEYGIRYACMLNSLRFCLCADEKKARPVEEKKNGWFLVSQQSTIYDGVEAQASLAKICTEQCNDIQFKAMKFGYDDGATVRANATNCAFDSRRS